MKRQITVLSGLLLFASVSFAQTVKVPAAHLTKALDKIAPYNGEIKQTNSGSAKAVGATLWSSDFSESPAVWTMGTAGQGSFQIGTTGSPEMNQYFGVMASTTAANGYAFFDGITFLIAENVDPQNAWITTEAIDFTGHDNAEISFEQRYRKFNTDVTYVEFSADGGATWTLSKVINDEYETNDPSVQNTLSLVFNVNNSPNGMFRFRWENPSSDDQYGSGYGWAVDDVEVRALSDYDLVYTYGLYHYESYQYSQIPTTQITDIEVRAGVRNDGSQDLTNVKLVLGGDVTAESPAITLTSLAVDTLEAVFTPVATVGDYTVTRTLVMDQTDDNPINNPIPDFSYSITNHIYAVDKGAPYSDFPLTSLSFGGTPAVVEGIGTSYDIAANQAVHGVDFRFFTGAAVGAEVYAEIYEYNTEATTAAQAWNGPLGYSDMFTLENTAQIDQIQTLKLNSPVNLLAGKTYLALIHISGTETVKLAAGGTGSTAQGWIKVQGTQGWGTFTAIPVVRMNFDPTLNIADNKDAVSGVSIFPNPATEKVNVEFNLKNASDVSVEVMDITGKVVETLSLTSASVGANTAELNVSNYSAGIYSVSVKSNDSSVTKKLVIR